MKKIILTAAIILWAASAAPAQVVSFKLAGGLTSIDGSDYNQALTGLNRILEDTSSSLTGRFEPLRSGLHFQAEIINWFFPAFGVGLGGGYYRVSRENTVTGQGLSSGVPYDFLSTVSARVSAIPIFINLHVLLRPLSRLAVDVFAGPVFQVVQFNFENTLISSFGSLDQTETFTASQTAFGGQAGLGLNLDLFPGASLVVEGCQRFGRVANLQGNWSLRGTSDLGPINQTSAEAVAWYYELAAGAVYPRLGFFGSGGPAGEGVSNARKAELDLSGLVVSAGVKLSF